MNFESKLIRVTQEHIDKGKCANPRVCALSLAINDAIAPGEEFPRYTPLVESQSVLFQDNWTHESKSILLPAIAELFVWRYDSPRAVEIAKAQPFEFTMLVPR